MPSQTFCDTEVRALEAAGFELEIYSCSPPTTSFRHGVGDWPRARVSYAPPRDSLDWWETAARHEGHWPAATIARHEAEYGPRYEPAKRARHALYFAGLLRRQGVEHLHVHFANRATHAALFIHELTGIPFSFTAHAQDFLVDLGSDALLGEMCEKAAFVVAVSEWSRRALIEKCPSAEAKIHRVYNGLPLDRWPTTRPSAPVLSGGLRIFSIGRLVDFKGFPDLAVACANLKAWKIPFVCEIAGEGPVRDALQRLIIDLGIKENVLLAGLLSQEEVRARLAACDVFALACRVDEKGACDVLPTVILEAMAAGKPVVSTRLAAVPEMVDDERTGLLVPPGDSQALAHALARLAADPNLRADFGAAGRAKWAAAFSADESARQLGALFSKAKAGPGPGRLRTPIVVPRSTVWCLFDRWPLAGEGASGPGSGSLFGLRRRLPGLRLLALATGSAPAATDQTEAALSVVMAFEFLPDAFVLETSWRLFSPEAHRIETFRGVIGNGCKTDDFLLAARRALHLYHDLQRGPTRLQHLHAVGPGAVLCAWLLVQLGAAGTASFSLGRESGLTGATLRRLAPAFVGGWIVGERKLAVSLGRGFGSDEPSPDEWLQAMEKWTEE